MNKIILVLVLLAGVLLGAWYFSGTMGTSTMPSGVVAQTDKISLKELNLRNEMRKLWEDHIVWTRSYLVSAASDSPDKETVAKRLLKNQEDLGNTIKPYYGEAAGNQLTSLLKEHITTAVSLVDAAKAGDQNTLNEANTKWYNNADQIADFLSSANPNLNREELRSMMRQHLDLTKQEAVDILGNKYTENIAGYDKVHEHILKMADILSVGIIKQFPDKFK